MTPLTVRWLKFNAIGALGILVQMGCFALLFSVFHLYYLAATALVAGSADSDPQWRQKVASEHQATLEIAPLSGVIIGFAKPL